MLNLLQTNLTKNNISYTMCMWCGWKVMRLATLCTIRQCCCLSHHMAVRLTPGIESVQVWTCYSYYAIVESVWSEVVFVRCVTKMDQQKFEQCCAIKFCVKLGESTTVTYENLQRAYGEQSLSRAQAQAENKWKTNLVQEDLQPQKRTTMWKKWGLLWGQIVDWRWEWSLKLNSVALVRERTREWSLVS